MEEIQVESEQEEFVKYLRNKEGLSEKTANDHKRVIRQYVEYHDELPPKPAEEKAYDYRNHLRSRKEKGDILSRHSNNHLVAIEYYYQWLDEEEGEDVEQVDITRFKEKNTEIKCMTKDEYSTLLRRGLTNLRDRAIFLFMSTSGIRVSEMCSLDIEDMIWSQNKTDRIRIKSNGKEIRYDKYRFGDTAKESIQKYLDTRPNTEPQDPLFTSLKDPYQRLGRSGVGQMLERASERAGLDRKITPHMCRAYMITEAIKDPDTNVEQVRDMVNHESIEQTSKYANLRDKDLDEIHGAIFD